MKIILISGGTKGIGRASVIKLLQEGNSVVTFSRKRENVEALENELKQNFKEEQFMVVEADVTYEEDCERVVHDVIRKFGKIDVVINNAGEGYFNSAEGFDLMRFRDMLSTNLIGTALLTKYSVPFMKQAKSGLIINISSMSGKQASANGEFYSAGKFGLMGYSEGIRNELKPFGIKVATICPGIVKTDFFTQEELEKLQRELNGQIPEMLEIEDVTRAISFVINQSDHCDVRDISLMPF